MTVIDCPNIAGAKAPIAPMLNTPEHDYTHSVLTRNGPIRSIGHSKVSRFQKSRESIKNLLSITIRIVFFVFYFSFFMHLFFKFQGTASFPTYYNLQITFMLLFRKFMRKVLKRVCSFYANERNFDKSFSNEL